MFRVSVLIMIAGALLSSSGCTGEAAGGAKVKTVPFSGKILLDGAAKGNVKVTFTPQGSEGGVRTAYAEVKEDGSFVATTYVTGDGIIPGKYNVSLGSADDGASTDPALMMSAIAGASIEKLEIDVPAEGLTDVDLKLTSSAAATDGGVGAGGGTGIGLKN